MFAIFHNSNIVHFDVSISLFDVLNFITEIHFEYFEKHDQIQDIGHQKLDTINWTNLCAKFRDGT